MCDEPSLSPSVSEDCCLFIIDIPALLEDLWKVVMVWGCYNTMLLGCGERQRQTEGSVKKCLKVSFLSY